MTQRVTKSELDKLPYISSLPTGGRLVPLLPFFDETSNDWHNYVPHSDEEFIRMQGGEPISGTYLGRVPADEVSDLELPLGSLLIQHLSFSDILAVLGKLESDVHRCAAILEKYHLLWKQRHDRVSAPLLIESELEYLLLLLRSFYDLLQDTARAVCRRVIHLDDPERRVMDDLPRSFARVALTEDEIAEVTHTMARYRMPQPLAEWYRAEAPFFRELRYLRDRIAHDGRRLSTVLETDWGFAIRTSEEPWKRFRVWSDELLCQNQLGPLRTVFAGFIEHSLGAAIRLAETIPTFLQLPEPLGNDLRLFVRSPFGHHLVRLTAILKQPWEGKDE